MTTPAPALVNIGSRNRFKRAVEVYRMNDRGEYAPPDIVSEGQLIPRAFPSVEIDIESIWTKK